MDAIDRTAFALSYPSRPNTSSSVSLNTSHVALARQRSSDNGTTLLFSKMNLSEVGTLAIEELAAIETESSEAESPVKRLALDNNHFTTLPRQFVLLHHLRYLNLKHNNFSVFPDVLTLMPSVDTLDLSHNKIRRLPAQAGSLVHLRVFSLAKNKLSRLPTYISQFKNLEVLQVTRNPIEWPPPSVMAKASELDSNDAMKDWISDLQRWVEAEHSGYGERNLDIYSSVTSHHLVLIVLDPTVSEINQHSWRFPPSSAHVQNSPPHSRSLSVDSSFSTFSISEALGSINDQATSAIPLRLGMLGSSSSDNSPTRSLESYLPSPADSEYFSDKAATNVDTSESQYHNRNASDGDEPHLAAHYSLPHQKKKSMPDLRTAKLNFTKKSKNVTHVVPSLMLPMRIRANDEVAVTSPQRQDSGSSFSSNRARGTSGVVSTMAFERYSYFERLSMRPASTALPKPLVCLIDSARSILFALCQVYQTLEHYMAHIADDRICSVLRKVVDPASVDMTQLINSLDRFDAMSQKVLPSPAICRNVVESCKDSVAVFGKAVGVLSLQLKLIVVGDDVRYSRWIMLELYGATAEVSSAWHMILPHIETIKPMLRPKVFPAHPLPSGNVTGSEIYVPTPSSLVPAVIDLSLRPSGSVNAGRVRTARRHAGSFSSKDVEIGKKLPSYDDAPHSSGGIVSGLAKNTPTPRVPKRQATAIPITTLSSPSPATLVPFDFSTPATVVFDLPRPSHSRENSQSSLQRSASSLSTPSKANTLDPPSNSKFLVDKEALQAVQDAVEVAPAVWDMIDDLFSDVLGSIQDTVEEARRLTKKLSKTLQLLHEAEVSVDRKELREDAHAFLKMVVHLSNVIKTYGGPRSVSPSLRTNMVKLTNSTEEFAILLHVSSFTSSTSRSHTPFLNISTSSLAPDDLRIVSSLSRSKSAQPSGTFKLPFSTQQDSPRSALPSKSFETPRIKYTPNRDGTAFDPG